MAGMSDLLTVRLVSKREAEPKLQAHFRHYDDSGAAFNQSACSMFYMPRAQYKAEVGGLFLSVASVTPSMTFAQVLHLEMFGLRLLRPGGSQVCTRPRCQQAVSPGL